MKKAWLAVFFGVLLIAGCSSSGSEGTKDAGTEDVGGSQDAPTDQAGTEDTAQETTKDTVKDTQPDKQADTTSDPGKPDLPEEEVTSGKICPEDFKPSNCAELAACLLACEDQDYLNSCKADAPQTAVQAYAKLEQCIDMLNCGAPFNGEIFTEDVRKNCASEIEGCFVSEGTDKCDDIVNCRKDCQPGDTMCPLLCMAKANSWETLEAYQDYVACVMEVDCVAKFHQVMPNGWPQTQCENQAMGLCANQWKACYQPH